MLARYYGSGVCRFLSPDPVARTQKSLYRPARWNRFTYAVGNPVRFLDPDGRDEIQFGNRRFEAYPGDVLVLESPRGGQHVATYVGGGKEGEIRVVDNTAARNQKLTGTSEKMKARNSDNEGKSHSPHDILAPANGKPNKWSPDGGATALGVVPAQNSSTTEAVEAAASGVEMYHNDPDARNPQECSDFCDEMDDELGTGIGADESKGTEGFTEKIDTTRETSTSERD